MVSKRFDKKDKNGWLCLKLLESQLAGFLKMEEKFVSIIKTKPKKVIIIAAEE